MVSSRGDRRIILESSGEHVLAPSQSREGGPGEQARDPKAAFLQERRMGHPQQRAGCDDHRTQFDVHKGLGEIQ